MKKLSDIIFVTGSTLRKNYAHLIACFLLGSCATGSTSTIPQVTTTIKQPPSRPPVVKQVARPDLKDIVVAPLPKLEVGSSPIQCNLSDAIRCSISPTD